MELQFETPTPAQPVTVLGRTFATDDERRTHFRNELRKLLPELKHIEGFPIGEDEDILNLSDPPYYTACPNPWLNDFIAEWEAEKTELQTQGKRVANFEVDAPYASDVSEGKFDPMYLYHPYLTKVPHKAIMKYILHYTQPGDIVFDGFAGTGMTGVAARLCDNLDQSSKNIFESQESKKIEWGQRKAICGDLSPLASFISYNYNILYDINSFETEALRILNDVESECSWMFQTDHVNGDFGVVNYTLWSDVFVCNNCNNELVFWDNAVDIVNGKVKESFYCPSCNTLTQKKALKNSLNTTYDSVVAHNVTQNKIVPVLISYTYKGKRYEKKPTRFDINNSERIQSTDFDMWIPNTRMPDGDESRRNDKRGITHVHQFYTKRNLIILSYLKSKITNPIFNVLITKVAFQNTKLYRYTYQSGVWGAGGGPLSGTLYIPSLIKELNIIKQIKDAIKGRRKITSADNISSVLNTVQSLTDFKNINTNSIDYIFTDPPFGSNLMYSELNVLAESWLKILTNNKEEAIENKTQIKNAFSYQTLMSICFSEYYRLLKSGKWMTVEFSNTSAAIWNGIQIAIQNAGFIIANVAALDKQKESFKAVTTPTAVKQDLVISCYKPSSEFDTKFQQSQFNEVGIWDFVAEHLNHLPIHLVRDNATTAVIERSPKILFDRLIAFYVQRSLPVPIDAALFQKGLSERFVERDGMYFTANQVHEYDSKKAAIPNFIQLSLLVATEQDGVMWLRRELESTPQTYQELQPKWMQALAGARKGDIIPELRDILEDNFLANESGAWYIPDMENEIDLEKVRTRRLLKQFDTYREQASKPKGKLKEVRVEALRTGFKQCYTVKDFKTIVTIGDSIPNNLLMEDEVLLQYYDIAVSRV